MQLRYTLVIPAVLLLASGNALQPGEPPAPRALVEKAIEAIGGHEALEKHKAAMWTEKGTYYGMGEKGLPFTGKYAVQWPDQFRMEIENVFTMVINGAKGWVKSGDKTLDMDQKQLDVMIFNHKAGYMATLLPLKDKAFQLSNAGEAKIYERPALAIKVSREGYPEVKLYFDQATGLPMKIEYRTKSPEKDFKEVTTETYYKNYKRVEGIRTPTTIIIKQDDKVFVEADITELKAVGKLEDSTFAKP